MTATCLAVSAVGFGLIVSAVRRLTRLVKDSVLLRAPLVATQTIRFEHAGPAVMHGEAPLTLATMVGNRHGPLPPFRGLAFKLTRADTGLDLPLGGVLGFGKSSSFSRARAPLARLQIDEPGNHVLRVDNLTAGEGAPQCEFVFTRPYGGAMLVGILTLVAGGLLFIGGAVLAILAWTGTV